MAALLQKPPPNVQKSLELLCETGDNLSIGLPSFASSPSFALPNDPDPSAETIDKKEQNKLLCAIKWLDLSDDAARKLPDFMIDLIRELNKLTEKPFLYKVFGEEVGRYILKKMSTVKGMAWYCDCIHGLCPDMESHFILRMRRQAGHVLPSDWRWLWLRYLQFPVANVNFGQTFLRKMNDLFWFIHACQLERNTYKSLVYKVLGIKTLDDVLPRFTAIFQENVVTERRIRYLKDVSRKRKIERIRAEACGEKKPIPFCELPWTNEEMRFLREEIMIMEREEQGRVEAEVRRRYPELKWISRLNRLASAPHIGGQRNSYSSYQGQKERLIKRNTHFTYMSQDLQDRLQTIVADTQFNLSDFITLSPHSLDGLSPRALYTKNGIPIKNIGAARCLLQYKSTNLLSKEEFDELWRLSPRRTRQKSSQTPDISYPSDEHQLSSTASECGDSTYKSASTIYEQISAKYNRPGQCNSKGRLRKPGASSSVSSRSSRSSSKDETGKSISESTSSKTMSVSKGDVAKEDISKGDVSKGDVIKGDVSNTCSEIDTESKSVLWEYFTADIMNSESRTYYTAPEAAGITEASLSLNIDGNTDKQTSLGMGDLSSLLEPRCNAIKDTDNTSSDQCCEKDVCENNDKPHREWIWNPNPKPEEEVEEADAEADADRLLIWNWLPERLKQSELLKFPKCIQDKLTAKTPEETTPGERTPDSTSVQCITVIECSEKEGKKPREWIWKPEFYGQSAPELKAEESKSPHVYPWLPQRLIDSNAARFEVTKIARKPTPENETKTQTKPVESASSGQTAKPISSDQTLPSVSTLGTSEGTETNDDDTLIDLTDNVLNVLHETPHQQRPARTGSGTVCPAGHSNCDSLICNLLVPFESIKLSGIDNEQQNEDHHERANPELEQNDSKTSVSEYTTANAEELYSEILEQLAHEDGSEHSEASTYATTSNVEDMYMEALETPATSGTEEAGDKVDLVDSNFALKPILSRDLLGSITEDIIKGLTDAGHGKMKS